MKKKKCDHVFEEVRRQSDGCWSIIYYKCIKCGKEMVEDNT